MRAHPVGMKSRRAASVEFLERRLFLNAVSFISARTFPAGPFPEFVIISDFNHDGQGDLITTNGFQNKVSVLLGHGDGSFTPPVSYAAGKDPERVAVADLNGDGRSDVVVANTRS